MIIVSKIFKNDLLKNKFMRCLLCFRLFKANGRGRAFGPKCNVGDKVGCGVKFDQMREEDAAKQVVPVFFTRNGKEVSLATMPAKCHPQNR